MRELISKLTTPHSVAIIGDGGSMHYLNGFHPTVTNAFNLKATRIKPSPFVTIGMSGTPTIEHPTLHVDIGEVIDNTIDRIRFVHSYSSLIRN
jgi:hypothetical protein